MQAIDLAYLPLGPNRSPLIVQFIYFILNTSACCSLWCVAVVALERMCLVMCSSLVLFSAALSASLSFTLNYDYAWELVLYYILFNFFPLPVSFISSAIFLYKIKTSTRRVNPEQQNKSNRPSLLPIKIVAVASTFAFIVLIPIMCMSIRLLFYKFENSVQKQVENIIFRWFQILWLSNFTMKFFLYNIFIRHFRKEFVDICKKVKNKFIRN